MDIKKTGSFLKELRKEKSLTQEQLAEILGVAGRTVSRWETASNMPDLSMLVQIAEFYDVDISEIIEGERKIETASKEQKEILVKMSDYSNHKEKMLLRKLITVITIGIVAWIASFSFMLCFSSYAKGAEIILISGTAALLLYGTIMLSIKVNRSADGILNTVTGAVTAIVVSNATLLCIFFGSGSYKNYGLSGAFYSLLTFLTVFLITGIATSIINIKREKR